MDSQEIIKHLFEEFWFDGFAWSMMLLVCVPSACCSVGACLQTAGLVHCGTQRDKGLVLQHMAGGICHDCAGICPGRGHAVMSAQTNIPLRSTKVRMQLSFSKEDA